MHKHKYSIIIPVFNREDRIANAIQSVLNQSYDNFEIIVIDDGSTDQTAKVVQGFNEQKVHYYFQENKERGAARNLGITHSTGDFLTFLDSDDQFLPDHLLTMDKLIQLNPSGRFFCSSFKIVSDRQTRFNILPADVREKLIHENFLSCNGVFLQSELAKSNLFIEDRILAGLEDWELWLRIASSNEVISSKPITTQMNDHEGRSVLQTKKEEIEKRFETFYSYVLQNKEIIEFYKNKIHFLKAGCETYIALHLALTKKYRGAVLNHLAKGMLNSPAIIFKRRFYAILKRII